MVRKDASFGLNHQNIFREEPTKLQRDVCGNTDLYKVCCELYRHFYIYDCHWIILSYKTSFISWMFLWVLTSLYPSQVCGISLTRFKEFSKSCLCSFVDISVKGNDNFWRFHGLIDRFNKSCRHISSGLRKTADESMSVIQFLTTPKVDLPHYYYIFRNTEPLGTEMKNVMCSRLKTLLHLDIQKNKEAMKTPEFQKCIRGTTVCMKILAINTKGFGRLTLNDTYFADIWFSSVKAAGQLMAAGFNYYWPVKTSHKFFCISTLKRLMKDWPGGSYLVMKSTSRFPCVGPLLDIGYKYNYRKVLGFIAN